MKNQIRKHVLRMSVCALLAAMMLFTVSAQAAGVTPRYTGISELTISFDVSSRGVADCYAYMEVNRGYTADLTVELQRDGDTIKTWTASGAGTLEIEKTYAVTMGHDYQLVASAKVKNSNGTIVDRPYLASDFVYYD